ncbi:MAG TPA: aromatic amino acid transport family protein [Chlamydiales bacterium]|jgi:tyrosine-specific transport protein|nr:aromatic amino acid transport family protein [Chlamydiales bacterium]
MFNKTVSGTLLVAGTTIGAGMLGIPLLTAKAGFFPAMGITILVWLFMLATGLLFLEATLWMHEGANVLSMSRRFLGRGGKLAAGGMFLFLYYCLMVAYFAAGAPLFTSFLQQALGLAPEGVFGYLAYGLLFGGIVAFGLKAVDRINYLLMAALFISYFALLGTGANLVSAERFQEKNWGAMLFAAPVLFSSFGFHNVIPSLVTYFKRDVRVLRKSIFFGTLIPLLIFLLWQWLIIGAVPQSAIQEALNKGQPATAALQTLVGSPWVMKLGQFFAFFALITSMLGVAFSMVDFLADGLKMQRAGKQRILLSFIVFLPPFVLTVLDPAIFVTALGFAGGFGEAFLNGLIPVLLVWVGRYIRKMGGQEQIPGGRLLLAILLLLSLSVAVFELLVIF